MDLHGLPRRLDDSAGPRSGLRSAFDVDDDEGGGRPLVGRPPRRGGRRGGLSSSSFGPASGFGSRSALPSSLSAAAGGSGSISPFRRPVDVESSASASSRSSTEDEAVRATDGDASLSRLSAVEKGYLIDPFASFLVRTPPPSGRQSYLRPPLINLGTHARTWAIDTLVRRFLTDVVGEGEKGQVVSLGAGSDSRFWRFQADAQLADRLGSYVELDFGEITRQKAGLISRSERLSAMLGEHTVAADGTRLDSSTYHLLPLDLRDPQALSSALASIPSLSKRRPTLWLAECLLVYLPPEEADGLVRGLAGWNEGQAWVGGAVYEMFGFDDPFGKRMSQNLSARNIPLPSARSYPTLASQTERFLKAGYTQAGVRSIKEIQRGDLPREEAERVRKLELLDEVEEMELLFEHYAVSWGWRPKDGVNALEQQPWGLSS